jgi:hypothetical protein
MRQKCKFLIRSEVNYGFHYTDFDATQFLRHFFGITKLDKENNRCIREKHGVQNVVKEIKQYQQKWLQHVQRMDTNRIPKQTLQYTM